MRINKFVALATGMSRRTADGVLQGGRVKVNGAVAELGAQVTDADHVTLDGKTITAPPALQTVMLHKPVGYVVSRDGQGSDTVYDLLPHELQELKPVGRLDKNSSGLLLLTNDGNLANELTHPSHHKVKVYEVAVSTPLQPLHRQMISDFGIQLDDGPSKLQLERLEEGNDTGWRIHMHEGRNRQIRRTFKALGYEVVRLHRTHFGKYRLGDLPQGRFKNL
ncbi:MAG TPA: pseudouridine synthase [Candidatus Saccharimonadales bacterium]|nr:pseudouridine synthase [Candidatus Saccharimonadales bacterium]